MGIPRLGEENSYLHFVKHFGNNGKLLGPTWLNELRNDAISKFNAVGFPIRSRGNERWKYTDVRPIVNESFVQAAEIGDGRGLTLDELNEFGLLGMESDFLVFVDGFYRNDLSSFPDVPNTISIKNIRQLLVDQPDMLARYLNKYVDYESDAFCALNTVFFRDGAFIHIGDGVSIDKPLHIIFISTQGTRPVASYPRLMIVSGKDSSISVIETHVSKTGIKGLSNSVVELEIEAGAEVKYARVQRNSPDFFHISTTQVQQAEGSSFSSVALDLGAKLTRNNVNVVLAGEGATCDLKGFYAVSASQHVDNHISIDHAEPHTKSREMYKGVLADQSTAVFQGNILVRKGANKSDARQDDKNLLLSDAAEVNTNPSLQIFADDVQCGHGATSGSLDEMAMFYMQSRGLDPDTARRLIVRGFSTDVINTTNQQSIRTYLEDSIIARVNEF